MSSASWDTRASDAVPTWPGGRWFGLAGRLDLSDSTGLCTGPGGPPHLGHPVPCRASAPRGTRTPVPGVKSPVLMPSQLATQNNSRSASALGGTRTPDLLIRSQARFPLRYKGIRARRACPRQDSNLRPPGSEPGALSTAPRRPDAGVAYYDHRTAWPEERRHAHRSSWPHCPSGVRVSAGIRREPGGIRTPNRLGVNELRSHCATGPGARRDGGEPSASTARSGSMSPRRRQHDLTQGGHPGVWSVVHAGVEPAPSG